MKYFLSLLMLIALLSACGSGTESARLEVATKGIYAAAFSNSGDLAVLGSVLHGGSLWQLQPAERLFNWNHGGDERSVFIAADVSSEGHWAITAEAYSLVLWDIDSGQAARFWTAPGEVLALALARGGRYALLGLADHSAVIFNTVRGGVARTFTHQGRVRSVDLAENGRLAITGAEDNTAVIWQVATGEPWMTLQHREAVQTVAISGDGRYAFTAAKYDRAQLWDVSAKRVLKTLPLAKEKLKRGLRVTAARFSEDGEQLLLAYTNRKVVLWAVRSAQRLHSWTLSKRDPWAPTGVEAVALAFAKRSGHYYAMGSNGFVYTLER
ncbi:MAG: hypothetical protein KTR20_10965 [Cellvibrionaceae bacterium]|nr:hypothetical protein [Cellvibrionaceae bacterium]